MQDFIQILLIGIVCLVIGTFLGKVSEKIFSSANSLENGILKTLIIGGTGYFNFIFVWGLCLMGIVFIAVAFITSFGQGYDNELITGLSIFAVIGVIFVFKKWPPRQDANVNQNKKKNATDWDKL